MEGIIIIVGLLLILAGLKLIKISNSHRKDWEHWSGIQGSNIGTKAHTNYIITFVLGFVLAIGGTFVMVAAL